MQLKELVNQTIPSSTINNGIPSTSGQKISLPPISDILQSAILSSTPLPPQHQQVAPIAVPAPVPALVPPSLPHSSSSSSSFNQHHQSLPPLNQLPPLSMTSNNYNYYYSQSQPERASPNLPPYRFSQSQSQSQSQLQSQSQYQYHTSTPPNLLLRTNSYPSITSSSTSSTSSVPTITSGSIFNSPLSSPNSNNNHNLNQKRKTRNNLPKEITYILLRWLNDHLNHPYPSSFEKNELMTLTGLNQQQLSNWFINARRRKIKTLKEQKRLNF